MTRHKIRANFTALRAFYANRCPQVIRLYLTGATRGQKKGKNQSTLPLKTPLQRFEVLKFGNNVLAKNMD